MGAGPVQCGVRAEEALQRINAARAAGRRCGARYMPAAAPLKWDQQLYTAAFGHSSDMARRNYFDHRSPSGTTVGERVDAARYKWRGVGRTSRVATAASPTRCRAGWRAPSTART
ncbi:CAP domain-containing protein [Ramlibacter montanisoli]|uniref:CAP domain-containing protein n=1 Tax=Ramlibacter montanisoli TaxID=2732512 RepID=A0A849KI59_9BURK|nr:CAP domain-containing protein [Ramlibacter montanisoli]NNU44281.1 CAP domain-containing protein [Ramlibacter montanisoli]